MYSHKNKQKYKFAVVYEAGIMAGFVRWQHFTRITLKTRLSDQTSTRRSDAAERQTTV